MRERRKDGELELGDVGALRTLFLTVMPMRNIQ